MKKIGKLVMTALVAGSILTACGSKKEETASTDGKKKVSFVWWGAEVRHEKYIKAIELFEEKNPDIDIEFEYSAWDDYWKKLATKSAAGELPDVMQMDAAYVAQYGVKNQLSDLNEFVKSDGGIDVSQIDTSLIDTARLNDKLYAIAPSMNAMSMITNPQLLEKAGVTFDYDSWTFEDMAKGVSAVHDKTGGYGWIDVSDNSVLLQYFLRTKGEELYEYDKDGKPVLAFSKENFVEFMTTIQKLAKAGALPTAEVVNNLKSFDENPFSLGEAGVLQSWTNQYVTYQESAGENVTFSLELPYDAKETGALYYRPTFYYSMSQTSKVKDEAAKFIDFIVNDPEAAKIIGTERGIPSNNKNKELLYPDMSDTEKRTADYLTDVAEIVGEASPVPPIGYSELNNHFKDLYAEITYDTMTPAEAYQSFVEKAEEIFAENYTD
ncbi:carbohydrate ABC transporter substrate-binding protein [Vagococcus sp. BWB3-3]|uniref:Carbohydrate ABC transporter substrate-binding protein n=1 Tax=Vagococcus allomyrinae TaxID=2794353 RepID=A0A940P844_9ENTE|nr:ABC transporter substrate-binding protein [Vagococcus allomyrinae]MBP1040194.1 carbohydrate ABC transporter substrate-binding protein [Vagococcus allomyrinae]